MCVVPQETIPLRCRCRNIFVAESQTFDIERYLVYLLSVSERKSGLLRSQTTRGGPLNPSSAPMF
jgi:hypothetical protein